MKGREAAINLAAAAAAAFFEALNETFAHGMYCCCLLE